MKKFIVIGLGNFGANLARILEQNGCEVLGIDSSRAVIDGIKDEISLAVVGDGTSKELMDSLTLKDYDAAIIGIGRDLSPSTLCALYLKEIGIKDIIVRAISPDHGKILDKIGVHEIIYPEYEIASKLANRLSMKNALDYLPLSPEHGIVEVSPPKNFIGKTLRELQISARYHCQIIAIKQQKTKSMKKDSIIIPPSAEDIIEAASIMVIVGKLKDIEKIQKLK